MIKKLRKALYKWRLKRSDLLLIIEQFAHIAIRSPEDYHWALEILRRNTRDGRLYRWSRMKLHQLMWGL